MTSPIRVLPQTAALLAAALLIACSGETDGRGAADGKGAADRTAAAAPFGVVETSKDLAETTLDPRIQAVAEKALDEGLRATDKTQGWRGVERNLLDENRDLMAFDLPRWERPICVLCG